MANDQNQIPAQNMEEDLQDYIYNYHQGKLAFGHITVLSAFRTPTTMTLK